MIRVVINKKIYLGINKVNSPTSRILIGFSLCLNNENSEFNANGIDDDDGMQAQYLDSEFDDDEKLDILMMFKTIFMMS